MRRPRVAPPGRTLRCAAPRLRRGIYAGRAAVYVRFWRTSIDLYFTSRAFRVGVAAMGSRTGTRTQQCADAARWGKLKSRHAEEIVSFWWGVLERESWVVARAARRGGIPLQSLRRLIDRYPKLKKEVAKHARAGRPWHR